MTTAAVQALCGSCCTNGETEARSSLGRPSTRQRYTKTISWTACKWRILSRPLRSRRGCCRRERARKRVVACSPSDISYVLGAERGRAAAGFSTRRASNAGPEDVIVKVRHSHHSSLLYCICGNHPLSYFYRPATMLLLNIQTLITTFFTDLRV